MCIYAAASAAGLAVWLALAAPAAHGQSVTSLLIPSARHLETAQCYDGNFAGAALSGGRGSVSAEAGRWAPDTADNLICGASGTVRLGSRWTVGAGLRGCGDTEKYEVTDGSGVVTGTYAPKDILFSAGAAFLVSKSLSVGVKGRYVSSDLGPSAKGTAFCADVTAAWKRDALVLGLGLYNVGGGISYGGGSYSLPALARADVTYEVSGARLRAEADWLLAGALGGLLAAGYEIAGVVTPQVGCHLGSDGKGLPSYAFGGVGVRLSGATVRLSYLLGPDTLGGSVLAGLSWEW